MTSIPNGSAEMLSLLRTHTEQLKWTSKREMSMVKTVRKRMRWGDGALPTGFLNDFLRFEVHFSCSVWVLRRDSISAHVWYGLRTHLTYCLLLFFFLAPFCHSEFRIATLPTINAGEGGLDPFEEK